MKYFIITLALIFAIQFANSQEKTNKMENFDFLIGEWDITNKRLKERLNNSKEWLEFKATMKTTKMLNGLIIMDEMKAPILGKDFAGLTMRLFNPEKKEWTIYWTDTSNPDLKITEQVVGKFENGIGKFYGTEMFKGKMVKLKFTWKKMSNDTAYWDQAYFDESKNDWEVNWKMEFKRVK